MKYTVKWESLSNLANRLRFAKSKPSKPVVTINIHLADPFICQTFFCQTLEKRKFAKHSPCQTFQLYGISMYVYIYVYICVCVCVCMQLRHLPVAVISSTFTLTKIEQQSSDPSRTNSSSASPISSAKS